MKKIVTLIICIAVTAMIVSCGTDNKNSQGQNQNTGIATDSNIVLQIKSEGSNQSMQLSLADIKAIGTTTNQYSGRSKADNNTRVIGEYTGVPLYKLFDKAGYEDVKVFMVICSDGYTKEYEMDQLNDLYFFKNDADTKGTKVEPILAIVNNEALSSKDDGFNPADGTPLRIVFGQRNYDSKDTKDFNMQGWASFIETIVVEK